MSRTSLFSGLRRLPGSRRLKLAAVTIVPTAVILALGSQLLLPPFAQSRIADRLSSRFGAVRSLDVAASPAVKLLWGDADRVDVHLGAIDAEALAGSENGRLADVPQLRAEIDELATGMGDVSDVHLRKSGDAFDADMVIDSAAVGEDAEGRLALEPEVTSDGALYVALAGGPEPRGDGLRLRVVADGGAIVARPVGPGPLGRLIGSRTLFARDQLQFDSLRATPEGSGIRVELTGRTAS